MLVKMKVDEFVDLLASDSPAPGGGTIAAIAGAHSAGLGAMVCNLTIDNPKYPDAQPFLPEVREKLMQLKDQFLVLADEDTEAFNRVMAAFRLPKVTDEDKAARKAAIAEANIGAAQVPMTTAKAAVQVLELLPEVITYGNVNTLSDCGVATECAHVAGIGALMNVAINLPSIKDADKKQELEKMRDDTKKGLETAYKNVVGVLALKFDY